MSIQYDLYPTPDPENGSEKNYHARVVPSGRVTTDRLAKEIQKSSTLTEADVKAVLIALADKLAEHLGEGRKVHLDGIGYFQVNLQCKEEIHSIQSGHAENVEFKSVSYRADTELKKQLRNQKILRSRTKIHSQPMTEEEIDRKLAEHFAQNETLTRRGFQLLCLQVKTTAHRLLKKWVENGKLRNIGTRQSPVYVPDNGWYAKG